MTEPSARQPSPVLISLFLAVITLIAYYRVGQCGFVNIDDDAYVEFQPLVNKGIRSAGIAFAFTGSHSSNWHPLTTLSHMLDCTLFGVKAAPMHWENVLWHTLNSILVFLAWRSLTQTTWRSAIIAAVFALHPLHVESVAWISERKDVLHAFFWLLGLLAYAAYARTRSWKNYVLVALALVFALLSKPMAVTFPCTLLLLDFWPLRRWPERSWLQLFLEKVPLFALVVVHSVLTFLVQSASGAANFGERFPLGARIGNAVVAYLRYLGKTFWPESLSPLYFHPGYWPAPVLIFAIIVLVTITLMAWRFWRTRPWLAFGWLWFLGTLVPVIGLVQVGAQSMADRYMYVPILGVLTIILWEGSAAIALWPRIRTPLIAATVAALVGCGVLTLRQVKAWRNSITLLEHSIAVGEDNPGIRYLLAVAFAAAGRPESDVVAQFRRALELRPDYVNAMTQLAAIAIAHGRFDEAQALVDKTVELEPRNPSLRANLGALAGRRGKPDEAIRHYEDVLRLDPKSAGAHFELGKIFLERKQFEQGLAHYEARARLAPWDAEAQCDYGTLLCNIGRLEESPPFLERALWLNPDFERARQNLATIQQGLKAKGPPPPQIK
jgi:protein O-mannosyl-transferase